MQEKEVKFLVHDLKELEKRLRRMGALLIHGRIFETNIRFDLPDGSLKHKHHLLRLRKDDKFRLTFKSASKTVDGVLLRQEYELVVDDYNQTMSFLNGLGYKPIFTYEKYRSTYEFKDIKIMLDELPIGDYGIQMFREV